MSRRAEDASGSRGGFEPPFCPNPSCDYHRPREGWRFVRNGWHLRTSDQRRIQDYRCCHCRRYFSVPTFSTAYWLRRRDLLLPVADWISQGGGLRQIARGLHTTHTTVRRHVARIGRHCMLFHRNLLREFELEEALVIDGFETFEYSQYYPCHLNLAAGAESWFIYHFTDSPLRRRGRMTDRQRQRRVALERLYGRPDPKAVEKGIAALIRPLLRHLRRPGRLVLHSDDHPAYRRSLQRLRGEGEVVTAGGDGVWIEHRITSSRERRTRSNPLFPVNLADLLIRHSQANHRRETIAFSKRRQGALERLAVFVVWRNCIKRRRENGPAASAAMWVGRWDRLLTWREVLRHRLFPGHTDLPEQWRDYYWGRVKTVILGDRQRIHSARYAF